MEATAPDIIRRLADGRAAARLPTILPVRPNWVTLAAASLLTGAARTPRWIIDRLCP
jgi:hypothetical protein